MNNISNVIFSAFFSWLKSVIQMIYGAVTQPEHLSLLTFIANNWVLLLIILLVVGTAIDLTVYLFRWRPFEVWRSFFRRLIHRGKPRVKASRAAAQSMPTVGSVPEDDAYVIPDTGLQRSPENLVYMDPMTDVEYSTAQEETEETGEEIQVMEEMDAEVVPEEHRRRRHVKTKEKTGGLRHLIRKILAEDEAEPDPLRYTAAPPPVDARDAYNEPYIPPQWKSPEPVGIRKKRSEKEKQDDA